MKTLFQLLFQLLIVFLLLYIVFKLHDISHTLDSLHQVEIKADTTYTPVYGIRDNKWCIVDTTSNITHTTILLTKSTNK